MFDQLTDDRIIKIKSKKSYTPDEGNYKQAMHKNYIIKIYDKQKHYIAKGYNVLNAVMRFEIKYRRQHLNQVIGKEGVITLQDVLDYEPNKFKEKLIQE